MGQFPPLGIINENQIKHVFIEDPGAGYAGGEVPIVGDGSGAKAVVTVDSLGRITDVVICCIIIHDMY